VIYKQPDTYPERLVSTTSGKSKPRKPANPGSPGKRLSKRQRKYALYYFLFIIRRYRDAAVNTAEENSSVFSISRMC